MIIGSGDIASVLETVDQPHILFFASGVSNSQETSKEAYEREVGLLMGQSTSYHLVYFSSLSVYYADTPYTRHKLAQEVRIRARFPNYTIVRLGNITWGDNPHTLINFFAQQLRDGIEPVIENTDRYIVGKDEFLRWMGMVPEFSGDMNIPGERMSVREVWKRYVGHRDDLKAPHPLDRHQVPA